MFEELIEALKAAEKKTIVFTEGTDARILEAADRLLKGGFLQPILVGVVEDVKAAAKAGGFEIEGAEIIDPAAYEGMDEMVAKMVELRKGKMTPEDCRKNLAKGNKTVTNWIDNAGGIESFLETPENVRGYMEKLKAEGRLNEIPPVYIATGGDDDEAHLKQFTNWVEYCREMGLDITVNIEEGYGHDGWYFDKEIKNVLRFFGFNIKNL